MLRRQDILKAVGTRGQKRLGFFGNMGGMIVQDDSDSAFRGIPRVEVAQQANEFDLDKAGQRLSWGCENSSANRQCERCYGPACSKPFLRAARAFSVLLSQRVLAGSVF